MACAIHNMTSLVRPGFSRHLACVPARNLQSHAAYHLIRSCNTWNKTLALREPCYELNTSRHQSHVYGPFRLEPWCKRKEFHHLSWRLSQPSGRRLREESDESSKRGTPDEKPAPSITKPTELLRRISKSAMPPITRHENIYTLPNILTFTRLLAAPAVGYFVLTHQPMAAMLLFFYAGVTDAVDGWLARRYNLQTVVGTVIDPMADKALMTISVVALGVTGVFPWWLATIILGRDVALAISAIYFRWISLPPPKTMARYWDFSLPSAEVHPTEISKINTLLQLLLVGNGMLLPVLPVDLINAYNLQGIFEGWQFLVAGTTIWSGLSYVFNKDAVKILSQEEVKEKELEKAETQAKEDQKQR